MRLGTLLLLLPLAAQADGPKIQRGQFYCLSNVAKLGSDLLRPVANKENRSFVLAKVTHAGTPGYYLVDMGTTTDSTISFLDGRIAGGLNQPDVKEALPAELLKVLQADKAKAKPISNAEAAKYARPQPVKNEEAYGALSQNVIAVLKPNEGHAAPAVPEECHAFGDLIAQLTDQAWAAKPAAPAPAKK
ncbi:MAG: hypothetical protein EOP11_13500 [Proteobacteria bacterium]|nr:MAG: hypothetical protein EOP11_13500 [Pseudomonadota bacterium]